MSEDLQGGLTTRDAEAFSPSSSQSVAKAKFWSRFQEESGLLDLESLTKEDVNRLSGSRYTSGWLKEPGFARWFFEKDSLVHRIHALKERVVDVLEDILTSDYEEKILTAKDKLKAADILLQVTGSYPSRTKEVVFADARLNAMTDDEVEKELQAVKKSLSSSFT